ncbi:hypothetical protein MASR2M79_19390 [Aminivibrio sp.]
MASNRNESGLKKEIQKYFKEADEADAREESFTAPTGEGDELPPELSTEEKRIRKIKEIERPRGKGGKVVPGEKDRRS